VTDHLALWHTEHANFARLLTLLEAQLDRFHRDDGPDYEQMLDIMYYMTHYPDQLHHPREDQAFARIVPREPDVRPVVDELLRQHEALRAAGDALVRVLDDIVNGSVVSREAVDIPGRAYIASFRGHMQKEESEIFPAAARVLGATDWTAIVAAIAHRDDPLFGRTALKRFSALQQQIARHAE
jgi:hemerythrin-like domain-containing protein